jgi:hypothetical protein
MPPPTESFEILKVLARRRVDFIVVGMTAAVLQGAPVHTFDLDIIYALDDETSSGSWLRSMTSLPSSVGTSVAVASGQTRLT